MHPRCNSCNLRRTKCSGDRPCTQCAASSRECVYPVAAPKVSISRAELEDLRRRVEAYDRALQDVVPDADKRRELLGSPGAGSPIEGSPSSLAPQHQPLSPVKTEVTGTTNDEPPSPTSGEGHLLHDGVGTARFHGETSEVAFVDELKSFLRGLLPPNEASTLPRSIGRCQSSDSRPLPAPDNNPFWLPPPNTTRAMLNVLRSFVQDGSDDQPSPSGGIFWWGNLTSQPAVPSSSGHVETDTRSARRLAFYQTALAVACRIASTKPSAAGLTPDRSETFFARASTLLGNQLDMSRCSVGEVSVLTLMAYYMLEADRLEAAAVYVSLAARISIGLGAHRGYVDERGKRIFWTLYVLDRWVSSLLGRPPAIADEAILLPLPLDAPYVKLPFASTQALTPNRSMPPSAGLRAHVELSRISDHITCNVYRVAPSRDAADGSTASRDKALFLLEQWQLGLPSTLQLSAEGLSNDPATCNLHMHANHLLILSLRPFLLSAVKATLSHDSLSPPSAPQWESCIAAALRNMRLARHVATLHRPRRLVHSSLHFVFSAVLCFLLQGLLGSDDLTTSREVNFAVELCDRESQTGNTYGLACANALREVQMLVAKRRGRATAMGVEQAFEQHMSQDTSWPGSDISQATSQTGDGPSLHEDVLSWMDHDWSYNPQYSQ